MKPKSKYAPAKKRAQILLVDDHPMMRDGIVQWIQRTDDLEVCAQTDSANQALTLVARIKPDLVLTDISLTDRSGLDLVKDLHALYPKLLLLVLSMHDETIYAARALHAGARGYVMKSAGGEGVVDAIHDVLKGRIAVSPQMTTHLLEEYSGRHSPSGRTRLPKLTDREYEILLLIGEARNNREIATRLHLSPKTVETHRLNLARKLKVKSAPELLRFALQYVDKSAFQGRQA